MSRSLRFEKWYAERICCTPKEVADMWSCSTYWSSTYHVQIAWEAWCAALARNE